MVNSTKKTLLALSVVAAMGMGIGTQAFAADVPAGVQLADKQDLIRNNGSEPQSLDPHKVEGVPEANIIRDLMEGITLEGPSGEILRVRPSPGKIKILKSGRLKSAKMQNGPTATRSPHRTSFTAGAAWLIRIPHHRMPVISSMLTW